MVVAGDRDLGEEHPLDIVSNEVTEVDGVKVIYLSPDQINANRFVEIVKGFQPNIIHLNSLFSANFTLLPLKTFKHHPAQVIISPRGMFGPASLKIKPLKKKAFFVYAKVTALFKDVIWHATSDIEAKEIQGKMGESATVKVANNVPFLPESAAPAPNKVDNSIKLLSVGRLAPIKNFDFLLESLKTATSDVKLTIVGPQEDFAYYQACQDIANQLPQNISVDFLGGLSPIAISKLYADAHVFITATKNENFGHSIAEALGFGRPVIVSDKTPWKNLEAKGAGFDLSLDKEKFAKSVDYFASLNQERYQKYCADARKVAIEVADPKTILANYASLYKL